VSIAFTSHGLVSYEGSIFDGEIIKTKSGSWNYLIHDCLSYNGTSFIERNHDL
jgi:hypothetical protein